MNLNRVFTGKTKIKAKRVRQLLTGSIPFFTFLMFGGALEFSGLLHMAWESGYLPYIPDTEFPATITKVAPAFTIVSLFGAPIRLVTAGLSRKYHLSQNIGRPGAEDIPVFLIYYGLYLVSVFVTGIELTTTNILGGAVAIGLVLIYTSAPVYVMDDPTVPDTIDSTIDGAYVMLAMALIIALMSLAGVYLLAAVQGG